MKEWRTAQEYAALKLDDFPSTQQGVDNWFKSRDLDILCPKWVRRRDGRGGGMERHFKLLPLFAQTDLRRREIEVVKLPSLMVKPPSLAAANLNAPVSDITPESSPPPTTQAGERRREAILMVLMFWDGFRADYPTGAEVARHLFVASYRQRKLQRMPDWVFEALTFQSGKARKLSINTLRNWEKRRKSGDLNGLGGRYGARSGTGVLDVAEDGRVANFIGALIIKQPHLTTDHIRDLTRAEFGDQLSVNGKMRAVPPIRNFQRFTAKWKKDHAEVLLKKTDPDAFKSHMRASGSNMNHWVTRTNQLWEIDASPADVLLTDGRYSIYAVIDIYTRRMLVTVSKTAKTSAVLLLMRKAILAWGVPKSLRTDNGSDFKSYEFMRNMTALGIDQKVTAPFSPEQKGTVERAIGTLQRGFMVLEPSFIGHNVTDRKKIEARKSFAQRLGESAENADVIDLTAAELQADIDRWLDAKYSHKPHAGLNDETPFARAAACTSTIRRIENERALDMMLAPVAGNDGQRVITKSGIRVDHLRYGHPDMVRQTRVFCRHDPDDLGRLYVYDVDGREFLYVAECPEALGIDPGAFHRAMRAAQAERIKAQAAPLDAITSKMEKRDLMESVLRVNEADNATLAAFPIDKSRHAEIHTTPELDAAADALVEPAGPPPLSDADRAIADAKLAEMNYRKTGDGDQWVADAIAASPSGYIHMPIAPGQDRPKLWTDEAMTHWLIDFPERGNSELDFAYINGILKKNLDFRLLIFESAEMRQLECPESLKIKA